MATEITARDRAWRAVLRALADADGVIRAEDVREHLPPEPTERAAEMARKRTMWAMVDLGVLRHKQGSHDWSPGPEYHAIINGN